MKVRAIPANERWKNLASILDARFLLILCFLGVLLFSALDSRVANSWLDRQLFALGVRLQNDVSGLQNYVRVDVPRTDMEAFLRDPTATTSVGNFLARWDQGYTRGAVLVLPETLWPHYAASEFLLAHALVITPVLTETAQTALRQLTSATRLYGSLLVDERLIRTHIPDATQSSTAFQLSVPALGGRTDLRNDIFSRFSGSAVKQTEMPIAAVDVLTLERSLLWLDAQGNTQLDAALALFLRQQNAGQQDWKVVANGVQLRDQIFPLSVNGSFMPHFSQASGRLPSIIRIPVADLTAQDSIRRLHEKTVVIGVDDDKAADDLLYAAISLNSEHFVVAPAWFVWLHLSVMLAILLYLLLLPYMPLKVGAALTAVQLIAMILAQLICMVLHRLWFPIGLWVGFLLLGHVLTVLWCLRRVYISSPAMPQPAAQRVGGRVGTTGRVAPSFGSDLDGGDDADTVVLPAGKSVKSSSVVARSTTAQITSSRRSLGRYEVRRELGRGAMGVVYLGHDPRIARDVAIKTLHYNHFEAAELVSVKERFFREAAAAGRLRHPNIVTILDVGEEPDLAFIAMEYAKGQPLSAYTKRENLLDVETVYWITAMVADAIDYANSQGIVHRDIKPSNILFDDMANEVKVADFGIARIMDGSATRTRTGDILGSPLYMSPEQLKGEQVTGASDIFSLGVTFYQLLTGELPFKGDSLANLSYQIVQCKFKPIDEVRPDLPDSARKIVNKALQKSPANRYAGAREMLEQLQRALSKDFP